MQDNTLQSWVYREVAPTVETEDGLRWLTSYIDPAHGNCATVPDEDNLPSIALQTNWNFTIDKDFFVQTGYTEDVPNLDFVVFGTPLPEYPIAVFGIFYIMTNGQPSRVRRLVLLKDDNLVNFAGNGKITAIRGMYKGFTATYTGNEYNNEGSIVTSYVVPNMQERVQAASGEDAGWTQLSIDGTDLPLDTNQVSNSYLGFQNFRVPDGVYMVQQYNGQRSDYYSFQDVVFDFGGVSGVASTVVEYAQRFSTGTNSVAISWYTNWNWTCAAFENMNSDQSVLLRIYAGWQCHYTFDSGFSILETHKSYLDMSAVIMASKINSMVPSMYPASYNDLRKVWGKIKSVLSSKALKTAVDAVGSTLGGAWGIGANLYNAVFCIVCNKHIQLEMFTWQDFAVRYHWFIVLQHVVGPRSEDLFDHHLHIARRVIVVFADHSVAFHFSLNLVHAVETSLSVSASRLKSLVQSSVESVPACTQFS